MSNKTNFLDLVFIVIKSWWIILVLAIVFSAASYGYTKVFVDELYTSRGLLYVNSSREQESLSVDLTALTTSQKLVNTCGIILKSDKFMNKVNVALGGKYSAATLKSNVVFTVKSETEILEVKAVSTDPTYAYNLVNAILQEADSGISSIINGASVSIIDNASMPIVPSSPDVERNVFMGTLIGGVLGVVIAFVIELLDRKVREQNDLVEQFDLPVLGLIPRIIPGRYY